MAGDDEEGPAYILSLHKCLRDNHYGTRLVRKFETARYGDVYVHRIPLLTSRNMRTVSVRKNDDGEVVLHGALDHHGRFLWMQIRAEHAGRSVAVAVDGMYRFLWRVPRMAEADDRLIAIDGPWEEKEARSIAERAQADDANEKAN